MQTKEPTPAVTPEPTDELNLEQRQLIITRLNERGVALNCPRCANHKFDLITGLAKLVIQPLANTINLGGKNVPVVITACDRCGFVGLHALGYLGFDVAENIMI